MTQRVKLIAIAILTATETKTATIHAIQINIHGQDLPMKNNFLFYLTLTEK